MYKILDRIDNIKDLKRLDMDELKGLCSDIRSFLVDHVSETGGHLAPNLGVVELTVALHYVFDSPDDKIIFDVGHQCYTHKILTGRKEQFTTLRKLDGLSGFPKSYESEHDIFSTGHSSTSISSAIGIATANKLAEKDDYTIAVIGDGAMTGGLAFEALNNANIKGTNLIVILNDNQMSISPSVGNIAKDLSKIRSSGFYRSSKNGVKRFLRRIPFLGKLITKFWDWIVDGFKYALLPKSTLFEHFGFTYLGPIDGHDLRDLTDILELAKEANKPVIVHVVTKKGKGYSYAEKTPDVYHGVGPFDKEKG
ncbi:MAG: 1-deoxy-D-xylulose-5-phosphate synthase, partial [Clostridia bacterium]|nr:1-deoxy-D-xylulose-5-phosphate synthase [Clostridia bacterium]